MNEPNPAFIWHQPGVHAVPQTRLDGEYYVKAHGNPHQFEREVSLRRIACAAGCAPDFTVEDPRSLRTRKLVQLGEWLEQASEPQRRAMALAILQQLAALHTAGVCHRDLKVGDVVLDDGRPLFIDFDLSTEVDPAQTCYDLYGPASGVPVPPIHLHFGLAEGVWWDSVALPGLSSAFGPLTVYLPG